MNYSKIPSEWGFTVLLNGTESFQNSTINMLQKTTTGSSSLVFGQKNSSWHSRYFNVCLSTTLPNPPPKNSPGNLIAEVIFLHIGPQWTHTERQVCQPMMEPTSPQGTWKRMQHLLYEQVFSKSLSRSASLKLYSTWFLEMGQRVTGKAGNKTCFLICSTLPTTCVLEESAAHEGLLCFLESYPLA